MREDYNFYYQRIEDGFRVCTSQKLIFRSVNRYEVFVKSSRAELWLIEWGKKSPQLSRLMGTTKHNVSDKFQLSCCWELQQQFAAWQQSTAANDMKVKRSRMVKVVSWWPRHGYRSLAADNFYWCFFYGSIHNIVIEQFGQVIFLRQNSNFRF